MFKNIMLAIIALSSVVVAVSSVIYVVKMPSCDPMAVIAKWEETKAALKEQPDNKDGGYGTPVNRPFTPMNTTGYVKQRASESSEQLVH